MTTMRPGTFLQALLTACGLEDLTHQPVLGRADLERVLAAGNPVAAAALADAHRAVASGATVTLPLTLRVRTPCIDYVAEPPALVSHLPQDAVGIAATEIELIGALPDDADLQALAEIVGCVREDHPDLPIRAFTADEIAAVARSENRSLDEVVVGLRDAGWTTLSWAAGCERDVLAPNWNGRRTGYREHFVCELAGSQDRPPAAGGWMLEHLGKER